MKVDPTFEAADLLGLLSRRQAEPGKPSARFACRHCGLRAHADTNVAIIIRNAGLGIRRWNTLSS